MAAAEPFAKFVPLRGSSETALENGNRFLVPKDMRDGLGRDFVLRIAETGCIAAHPKPIWENMEREILGADPWNRGADRLRRLLYRWSAADVNCDSQGRLVLGEELRVPAKLTDEQGKKLTDKVLLIGAFDRVEIWSPAQYEKYEADEEGYAAERWAQFDKAFAAMRSGRARAHPIEEPAEGLIRRMGRG